MSTLKTLMQAADLLSEVPHDVNLQIESLLEEVQVDSSVGEGCGLQPEKADSKSK